MLNLIEGKEFDIRKFAEALEKNAQEAVKWERREEDSRRTASENEAA